MQSADMKAKLARARQAAARIPFKQISEAIAMVLDVAEATLERLEPVLYALENPPEPEPLPPAVEAPAEPSHPRPAQQQEHVSFRPAGAASPLGEAVFQRVHLTHLPEPAPPAADELPPPAEGEVRNEGGGLVEQHSIAGDSEAVSTVSNEGGGIVETHSIAHEPTAELTDRDGSA